MENFRHESARASGGHPKPDGIYVQVYPSTLVNASRMCKIAASVHQTGRFRQSQLVGVRANELPEFEELGPGQTIVRLSGSDRAGSVGQLLRLAFWQPRVYARYRRSQLSVVAAHNVWVLPVCWLLAVKTGAHLVYNCHELETETATMTGIKKSIAKSIEARLIRQCAIVSVVNKSIADWYESEYPIRRPVIVGNVPIVNDSDAGMRVRLGVAPDEMLYIHTGNIVEGRNIPLILNAFSSSKNHVVFLGDGDLRPLVLAARKRSPNIHWLKPVAPALVVAHVREADVGLCLIESGHGLSYQLSSPNKLLEALAANTPALCSELIEARVLLGPLADAWVLTEPIDLPAAIERIGKHDVRAFREAWQGTASWELNVRGLVDAYNRLSLPSVRTSRRSNDPTGRSTPLHERTVERAEER